MNLPAKQQQVIPTEPIGQNNQFNIYSFPQKQINPIGLKNQPNIYSFNTIAQQQVKPTQLKNQPDMYSFNSVTQQQVKPTNNQPNIYSFNAVTQQQNQLYIKPTDPQKLNIYSFNNINSFNVIKPLKQQRPPTRMQTGMDGMNFEEHCSSSQNFEEIKNELAQIVQQ